MTDTESAREARFEVCTVGRRGEALEVVGVSDSIIAANVLSLIASRRMECVEAVIIDRQTGRTIISRAAQPDV